MKELSKKKFNPGFLMSGFVIFFLPVLLFLGYWQITRGYEKQEMWERFTLNKSLPPLAESEILDLNIKNLNYRNVTITGKYMPRTFLLDNRIYKNQSGYEVFTAFVSRNQKVYLINRGWIDKNRIESIKAPGESLQIEGVYSPFVRFGLDLSNNPPGNKFPLIVQELTYEKVSNLLTKDIELEYSVIQLSAASQGSLEPIWKPSVFKASKHWAYAAQWLGLALALIYLFVYFGYKEKK